MKKGVGARPVGRGGSFHALPVASTSPQISMQSPTRSWRIGKRTRNSLYPVLLEFH